MLPEMKTFPFLPRTPVHGRTEEAAVDTEDRGEETGLEGEDRGPWFTCDVCWSPEREFSVNCLFGSFQYFN